MPANSRAFSRALMAGSAGSPKPVVVGTETLRQAWERITKTHVGYVSVPEPTLASYSQTTFPPGDFGPLSPHLGNTGENPWLGLLCGWNADAVISNDPRAAAYGLGVARIASWMPIHYKSHATGQLIKFSDFPSGSFQFSETMAGIDQEPNPYDWQIDIQHMPHMIFVPFMDAYTKRDVAVCRELLYHAQGFCTFCYMACPYYGRGYERGMFVTQMGATDLRGAAWAVVCLWQCLAMMMMLAEIDPTYTLVGDPMGPDLVNSAQWNIKYCAEQFLIDTPPFNDDAWGGPFYNIDPNDRLKNDFFGVFTQTNTYGPSYHPGDPHLWIAAWQSHFFTSAYQFAWGLYQAGYLPVDSVSGVYLGKIALQAGKLVTRLCGDSAAGGIDYRRGVHQYEIAVGSNASDGYYDIFTTDAQFITTNFTAQGLGALPSDTEIRYHGSNTVLDYITDGYAAMPLPTLAMAVRDGCPGAAAAWARVWASATFQRCRGYWPETINGIARKYSIFTPAGYDIDGSTP